MALVRETIDAETIETNKSITVLMENNALSLMSLGFSEMETSRTLSSFEKTFEDLKDNAKLIKLKRINLCIGGRGMKEVFEDVK